MPRFDGIGLLGEGPMTGRSEGFCILKRSEEDPNHMEGLAGVQGESVGKLGQVLRRIEKKVVNLPTVESMGSTTQRAINLSPRFKVPRSHHRQVCALVVSNDKETKEVTIFVKGNVKMPRGNGSRPIGPGRSMGRGQSRGRGPISRLFATGPGGSCICPKCAAVVPHVADQPCNLIICPRCGAQMIRA